MSREKSGRRGSDDVETEAPQWQAKAGKIAVFARISQEGCDEGCRTVDGVEHMFALVTESDGESDVRVLRRIKQLRGYETHGDVVTMEEIVWPQADVERLESAQGGYIQGDSGVFSFVGWWSPRHTYKDVTKIYIGSNMPEVTAADLRYTPWDGPKDPMAELRKTHKAQVSQYLTMYGAQ